MNWPEINRNYIAKSISELSFEEILIPVENKGSYVLNFESGVQYTFKARKTIWNMLVVDVYSILRNNELVDNAAQFIIDAKNELKLTDIVLSNFIEELNNTLYSDSFLNQKQKTINSKDLIKLPGEAIQSYLSGHPKLLNTKGRIGWGASEIDSFGAERENPISFNWVAIKKDVCEFSFDEKYKTQIEILSESFNDEVLSSFVQEHGHLLDEYIICPVHPWQWNRFIKIQFQNEIFEEKIIYLGNWGDNYLPQISLRTFSNVSRVGKLDIKLPISILNTSAVRGIANKYVKISSKLSTYIENICHEDTNLNSTYVLKEMGAVALVNSSYSQINKAPYRYKEYLGAIWRESQNSKIQSKNDENKELCIMTGALFHQDFMGRALISELVQASGLSIEEWLIKYFQIVIVPLYHLQAKYGIGLVAHGQNIVLKLTNYVPSGLIIKDFQGDLRLSDNSVLLSDDNFKECFELLDKLAPHYLIHDLLTGHFVTVLRFVSAALLEDEKFSEKVFYGLCAKVLRDYSSKNKVADNINLLTPKIIKVLVNKVRFEIGYQDSDIRPKPATGSDIDNPLIIGLKYLEEENE